MALKDNRIAIMQPYFFPYIGYFSLIKQTKQFILLDEVQYIKQGWINRNRILQHNTGWTYIKVPKIKQSQKTLVKDSVIDNRQNWKKSILDKIYVYKKVAPHFFSVYSLVKDLFDNQYNDFVKLNKDSLTLVCEYLNIQPDIRIFSEMNLEIENPKAPDEWSLNICKAIGNVEEYWNPLSGIDIFSKSKFYKENIKIWFQDVNIETYNQNQEPFIPRLSIIDVMMFNHVEKINEMLDNYELV